jgi:phosphoribosyl 1,2-cyclic phosphodiesterase
MTITVLGSGSRGNSALIRAGETSLLIDAGLSARQLAARITAAGADPDNLSGILLTHEHGDHIAGLDLFCKAHPTRVYATSRTIAALARDQRADCPKSFLALTQEPVQIGEISVEHFSVPHNAADPVGFLLHAKGRCCAFTTDLGCVTANMLESLRQADCVVLEANYDDSMLIGSPRDWTLKERIMSKSGHLSNADCAEAASYLAGWGMETLILAHLSSQCNSPGLARAFVSDVLDEVGCSDVQIHVAGQKDILGPIEV